MKYSWSPCAGGCQSKDILVWDSCLALHSLDWFCVISTLAHLLWYLIIFGIHNLFVCFSYLYISTVLVLSLGFIIFVYRISQVLFWILLGDEQRLGLWVFDRAITYIRIPPLFSMLTFDFWLNSCNLWLDFDCTCTFGILGWSMKKLGDFGLMAIKGELLGAKRSFYKRSNILRFNLAAWLPIKNVVFLQWC